MEWLLSSCKTARHPAADGTRSCLPLISKNRQHQIFNYFGFGTISSALVSLLLHGQAEARRGSTPEASRTSSQCPEERPVGSYTGGQLDLLSVSEEWLVGFHAGGQQDLLSVT
ncbi:hypothetical protein TREES_T100016301 [Tupaia chinensis]|uniref:Uncharacterized protein n=1 Tax=Tupaia chinensis TaxID=246437 RepID=L9KN36_TUPCH|nr:hypothetical protein TREES_T100016301 [Tupaia chinensis]